jgi:hypothetical protein
MMVAMITPAIKTSPTIGASAHVLFAEELMLVIVELNPA